MARVPTVADVPADHITAKIFSFIDMRKYVDSLVAGWEHKLFDFECRQPNIEYMWLVVYFRYYYIYLNRIN